MGANCGVVAEFHPIDAPLHASPPLPEDSTQHHAAFGSGGTVGFAPTGESVEGFGAGAVEQDGVVEPAGDISSEGDVGLAGEGGFEVFGHYFGPELHLYNGAKSFAEYRHVHEGSVPSEYAFTFQPSDSFSYGGGAEVNLFAQFAPANPAVQLECGDDSPVDLV